MWLLRWLINSEQDRTWFRITAKILTNYKLNNNLKWVLNTMKSFLTNYRWHFTQKIWVTKRYLACTRHKYSKLNKSPENHYSVTERWKNKWSDLLKSLTDRSGGSPCRRSSYHPLSFLVSQLLKSYISHLQSQVLAWPSLDQTWN